MLDVRLAHVRQTDGFNQLADPGEPGPHIHRQRGEFCVDVLV
jgi:hypothetical protein